MEFNYVQAPAGRRATGRQARGSNILLVQFWGRVYTAPQLINVNIYPIIV